MTNTKPTEPTSRHPSDADIGLDVIHTLRTEAARTGDSEQVALCDRALDGDQDALSECYRVIDAAAAMATPTTNSDGIKAWAGDMGAEEQWACGFGDRRLVGWARADGSRAIETNGDPMFDHEDGFEEAWSAGSPD